MRRRQVGLAWLLFSCANHCWPRPQRTRVSCINRVAFVFLNRACVAPPGVEPMCHLLEKSSHCVLATLTCSRRTERSLPRKQAEGLVPPPVLTPARVHLLTRIAPSPKRVDIAALQATKAQTRLRPCGPRAQRFSYDAGNIHLPRWRWRGAATNARRSRTGFLKVSNGKTPFVPFFFLLLARTRKHQHTQTRHTQTPNTLRSGRGESHWQVIINAGGPNR